MRTDEIHLPLTIPNTTIYSFEAIDGGGKTTQVTAVGAKIAEAGYSVAITACPSNTLLGIFIRENMGRFTPVERRTLLYLDMASIAIENAKRIVIADRWTDSNLVSNRDSDPEEEARWVVGLPRPRKTFLLDIDPEIVVAQRSESLHDHSFDVERQKMKRERYLNLAEAEPDRFVVVDATLDKSVITAHVVHAILSDLRQ